MLMKTSIKQLFLLIIIMVPATIFAQQVGSINGNVSDLHSGAMLPGATVSIKGTTHGTVTDEKGQYQFTNILPGDYTLVVSFVGYATQEVNVSLTAGEQLVKNIKLLSDLIGLDQVVVTGVVNPKSSLESSVSVSSLKPKAINRFGAMTTAEIFKDIPGIHSEATGGEGNANISVRGIPITSGGSKFLQLQEDGLPVMQFGDISFGNADIFLRADYTVARIEAIKGGSASTFASNSPAGIINFISKTGDIEGGTIGTSVGVDYRTFRTDFNYGSPIGNGVNFDIGGFYRQGEGPRKAGFTGNYGGQIKANLTKHFKSGYARFFVKYLNDRAISYMPMPIMGTGTAKDPKFQSVPGYDALKATLQSPYFLHIVGIGASGNLRTSNIADGMHPISSAFGSEFSFDLGNGWKVKNKARIAFNKGVFNSPFPASIAKANDIATSIAGAGYVASYANGANAGVALSSSDLQNLNGNGLFMIIHNFDVQINNLNNFTNDFYLTKTFNDIIHLTAGFYKAYQRIDMSWLWQAYLTDVSTDGPRLINLIGADSVPRTENGLYAHGVPLWGNCCTRGYDMRYAISAPYANIGLDLGKFSFDASLRYDMGRATGYYLGNMQTPIDIDNNGVMSAIDSTTTVLDNAHPHPVDYTYKYMSYSIGINYKFDDNKSVFARWSVGGRANADRLLYTPYITAAGKTVPGLEADKISQGELGTKIRAGIFALNLTGFYALLSEQNSEFNKIFYVDYQSYGAEFDGAVNFKGLNITVGGTYTKAKITKSNTADQVGKTPRRVPDLMYNISPSYSIAGISFGFTIIGTTKVFSQFNNKVVLPGFAYTNAFASYKITKGLLIRINSDNLFNTLGITEMEDDPFVDGATNYMRGRPLTGRATRLSIIYKF